MKALKIVLLATIGILLSSSGSFAQIFSDIVRIQLLTPSIEKMSVSTVDSSTTTQEVTTLPSTTGGSFSVVVKGIGVGYTTLTTTFEKETKISSTKDVLLVESTTLTTNFVDLSLTFGENYTIATGFGILSGGELKRDMNYGSSQEEAGVQDETISSDVITGTSLFIILGIHCEGYEILFGQRQNNIKATLNFEDSSAEKLSDDGTINIQNEAIEIKTIQAMVGIGLTF